MTRSVYISDNWTIQDELYFSDFKPALMDILQYGETPLTVGIFGEWGSGKTSMLRMLENAIDELPSDAGYRTVWFTAWKYDHHEALWRAFILRVLDRLYPKKNNGARYQLHELEKADNNWEIVKLLDQLVESVYHRLEWHEEANWSLDRNELAPQIIKLPISIALRLAGQGNIAKSFKLDPDFAKIVQRESHQFKMEQLESMEQFERAFADALKITLGDEGRLIVFVDDLDRCLPEKAIEILEGIKLFLNVNQTVFVLGMDRDIVCNGIENHYKASIQRDPGDLQSLSIDGDVYLQKLIQLPFNLPPLNKVGIEKLITSIEKNPELEVELDEMTRSVMIHGVYPNPRQIKRVLNIYNLLKTIALKQEQNNDFPDSAIVSWPLLAKTVLIQSQWPELYSLWRQYHKLVIQLEEEYASRPEDEWLSSMPHWTKQTFLPDVPDYDREKIAGERQHSDGILEQFLSNPRKYALLAQLLTFPQKVGEGRTRARFSGLKLEEIQLYLGLAATVGQDSALPPIDVSGSLIDDLISGDPVRVHDVLSHVQEHEAELQAKLTTAIEGQLLSVLHDSEVSVSQMVGAAEALGTLGWQPDDLYEFITIPDDRVRPAFYIGKYPVTNDQYKRFLQPENFSNPELWKGFPRYDNTGKQLSESWGGTPWDWLQVTLKDQTILKPNYWEDENRGIKRPGLPVVGVSWFEACAYARWVTEHFCTLEEGKQYPNIIPIIARLPTEQEWLTAVGGEKPDSRYPWDKPGAYTEEVSKIIRRTNVKECEIDRATPVWAYPLGTSWPYGLMNSAGNVWEWQSNFLDEEHKLLALRGGSYKLNKREARCAAQIGLEPINRVSRIGFRIVFYVQ